MMTEETSKPKAEETEIVNTTTQSPEGTAKVEESPEAMDLSSPTETIFQADDKAVEYPILEDRHSKEHIHQFFGKLKDIVVHHAGAAVYKKVDELIKEAKESWDQIKQAERQAALDKFKEANEGSEEGFTFKVDDLSQEIDSAIHLIKKMRQEFFQQLEKVREKALEGKTRLINELRTLVDADDNSDPAHVNASFKAFKKIQEEWKSLGSVQGPMNQTLWQSYHALVDRFYSNRSIFFELLELDRKKNFQAKETIAVKLESLAELVQKNAPLQKIMKDAEELFDEYKHIGPAHREENEALWQRVKKSLDVLFEQKRQVNEAQKAVFEENLKIKKELADLMHHHATFQSSSIAEWNQASKSVLALQEQWGKLKGGLPRESGKEVSHQFWSDLKLFFKHKSEFFAKIDAERKANLAAKLQLIEQVEGIVSVGTETPEITQQVIDLQKKWKEIGHVPEKLKDQIYTKFKAACDAYFNLKRSKGKGAQDEEFAANLGAKQAILAELEAMLKDPILLANLKAKKEAWDAIGYVPRKNVKEIQEKFRSTWNALIDLARTQPKEQLAAWGFELKSMSTDHGGHSEERRIPSADNRKRIQTLENDIAVLTNNLEFFAKSKGADKLRGEVEKKIAQAQKELDRLKKE
ncbi:DUF349 domain-containing protein [Aquirufa rosea]|nr:DUF349 domain-containing protein [Aquirufa rosea]